MITFRQSGVRRVVPGIICFALVFVSSLLEPAYVLAGPGGPGIAEMNLPVTDDLTIDPNLVRTYGAGDFNLHVRSILPAYTLIRFDTSDLPDSDLITYAELTLYLIANYDYAGEDEWLTISGRPPAFTWTEESYRPPSGSYLNSWPGTESRVTNPEIARPITWDVTDFAEAWADGEPNRGILLYPSDASPHRGEDSADFIFESKELAEVWGGNRPRLTVWYRSSSWFNWEIFQIIASIFNFTTPTPTMPAPYPMLRSLSPTPTQAPFQLQTEVFTQLLSPTPSPFVFNEDSYNLSPSLYVSPVPTSMPKEVQKSEYYQPTPVPTVVTKKEMPTSVAVPTEFKTKPTSTPTPTKVFVKPSPTPTSTKQIKGAFVASTEIFAPHILTFLSWFLILKILGL